MNFSNGPIEGVNFSNYQSVCFIKDGLTNCFLEQMVPQKVYLKIDHTKMKFLVSFIV